MISLFFNYRCKIQFITDCSLHSIGLILFIEKNHVYQEFLNDMIIHAGMMVIPLLIDEMGLVIELALRFNLIYDHLAKKI